MPDDYQDAIEQALTHGYASITVRGGKLTCLEMALRRRIGLVTTTELKVRSEEQAKPNTLSRIYGTKGFPHHTDYAFRPFPPRIIVLVNQATQAFETPTYVCKFSDLPAKALQIHARSQWNLRLGNISYVIGGVTHIGPHTIKKWDTSFLEPENGEAWVCVQKIASMMPDVQIKHDWTPEVALVIDNWNCTHARADMSSADGSNRELVRLEAWHHAGMDS